MTERPGVRNFVRALRVRRQAARGFAAGLVFAVAVYVFFVVLGGAVTPYRYLVLGFVLAVSSGLFFTVVLALVRARRLVDDLD